MWQRGRQESQAAKPKGRTLKRFWQHRPIKQKLIWITMLASSSALFFAAAAFVTYDVTTYRHTLASDLLIQLNVLDINNAAPLAFRDPDASRESLALLRADSRIMAAVIYDRDGQVFADYRRNPDTILPPQRTDADEVQFAGNYVDLHTPIHLDSDVIGHIAIRADLSGQQARLRSFLFISVGVLLAFFAVAFLIASRLQRTISDPITELTQIAQLVAQQKDYTAQARRHERR